MPRDSEGSTNSLKDETFNSLLPMTDRRPEPSPIKGSFAREDPWLLLERIASEFNQSSPDTLEAHLSGVLELLCGLFRASRCYIITLDDTGRSPQEVYQWPIPSQAYFDTGPSSPPLLEGPWLFPPLLPFAPLHLGALQGFPGLHTPRAELATVHSAIAVPVCLEGRVIGYLGLEASSPDHLWHPRETSFLRMIAQLLAPTMSRIQHVMGVHHAQHLTQVAQKRCDALSEQVSRLEAELAGRKELEEQLRFHSTHDPLTQLPNRTSFVESLKRAMAICRQGDLAALLMIDVDNFRIINETLGYRAGDHLLAAVASALKQQLPDSHLLARMGGDEFAILFPCAHSLEARAIAERLRAKIAALEVRLSQDAMPCHPTISVGGLLLDGRLEATRALAHADAALDAAREDGRNRVFLLDPGDSDRMARLSETNTLIGIIKDALKRERFVLMFQKIVDVKTHEVSHHEVLLRIPDENGRYIPPGRFIPVAERYGLMDRIDEWVVSASIQALRKWKSMRVFVNISGANLGDEALLERIESQIRGAGIDPSRLGFEITETTAVKDLAMAERWIWRLKHLGCPFALDDFGIGFSSFSYLRMLPVDFIKIDGSYVRDIDREPLHRELVEMMNNVAHILKKRTVAEFVENEPILAALRAVGVDCGQGYFLGKPTLIPDDEIAIY